MIDLVQFIISIGIYKTLYIVKRKEKYDIDHTSWLSNCQDQSNPTASTHYSNTGDTLHLSYYHHVILGYAGKGVGVQL